MSAGSPDKDFTDEETVIDRIQKTLTKYTQIHPVMARAFAYVVIAEIIGRRIRYRNAPSDTKWPNIWFLICGPSAITSKGEFERLMKLILFEVHYRLNKETFEVVLPKGWSGTEEETNELQKVQLKARFDMHCLEKGSAAGIADEIQEALPYGIHNFFFIGGEYSETMRNITDSESWEAGLLSLWNKLISGESTKVSLSKRAGGKTRWIPDDLFTNAVLFTQEPEDWLGKYHVTKGLLRRLCGMILRSDRDFSPDMHRSPIGEKKRELYEEAIPKLVDELVEFVGGFRGVEEIVVQTGKIEKRIEDISRRSYGEAIEGAKTSVIGKLVGTYEITKWQRTFKLATLEAVVRKDRIQSWSLGFELHPTEDDLRAAERYLNSEPMKAVDEAIRNIDVDEKLTPMDRARREKRERIRRMLSAGPIPCGRVRNKAHDWADGDMVLKEMANDLEIETVEVISGKYRVMHYRLVPEEEREKRRRAHLS